MWRSGATRRRRHIALNEMIETAVRSGEFHAPWRSSPQVWEHFADEADILRELQHDWRTAFAGAVYVAIERGEGDLQQDVMQAFRTIRSRYAGARAILEVHAEHPAIAAAMRKERALLSSFGGLLEDSDAAGAATQAA